MSESRPRPAPTASQAAPQESTTAVVLLGFRNDLARERVLAALRTPAFRPAPDAPLARDTAFPHELYARLPLDAAAAVRDEIERLGGQVALRQGGPPAAMPSVAAAPARRSAVRPLTMLLVILLGAAAHHWRAMQVPGTLSALSIAPDELQSLIGGDSAGDSGAGRLNQEGVTLANDHRYADASTKLRQALALAPEQAVVRRNLQVVLTNWGVRELDDGQPQAAIDRFGEALTLGDRPEVLSGLGIAYLRNHDYAMAIRYLADATARGAADPGVLLALGEAYEATDDRVRALEMYERARAGGLRSPQLQEHLRKLSREIDAEWDFVSRESRHFQVRFDAGQDLDAAHTVLDSLEAAYETVGRKLDFHPTERTVAVLYANEDFHDITQTPQWAGAVFDGRIKLPVRGLVDGDPSLDRIVRHEYTHSLIAVLTGGRVPIWLNEGLAMWAEEESPGDHRPWALAQLAGRELLRLDDLQAPFARLPADRAQQAYAQSYLTVLHLVEQYDSRRIPRLLDAAGKNRDFPSAFAGVYPIDLAKLEEEVTAILTR